MSHGKAKRRDWFPLHPLAAWGHNLHGGWKLAALLAWFALFAWHMPDSMLPMAIAVVSALGIQLLDRFLRPKRVRAWRLRASGLYEVFGNETQRGHPWSSIRSVTETPEGVEVDAGGTILRFTGRARDRSVLVEEIRSYLVEVEAESDSVSPKQIATWLQIAPDGFLAVRPTRRQRHLPSLLLWSVVLFNVGMALYHDDLRMRWAGLIFVVCSFLPMAIAASRQNTVLVSGYGLDGQGKRFAWADVDQVRLVGENDLRQLNVTSGNQSVTLRGPEVDRVTVAAERVIEARQAGAVPPRMGGVSEHGISRAEVEVREERGISPAEDGA